MTTTTKLDPRIVRTQKLIMDAFAHLLTSKEFKDITIQDITHEATVNRATFYYHFVDKYDLLEKVLRKEFTDTVCNQIAGYTLLDAATVTDIFLCVTRFQTSLYARCRSGFETFKTTIEAIIQKELEQAFGQMLMNQHGGASNESLRVAAVMLSWGMIGASMDWRQNSNLPAEQYIELTLPYVTRGLGSLMA